MRAQIMTTILNNDDSDTFLKPLFFIKICLIGAPCVAWEKNQTKCSIERHWGGREPDIEMG